MKKDEIYLKVECIGDMPEENRMSTEIYDPRDIIVTGWYKDRPDVMVDRQLMIEFPELKDLFIIFNYEEPTEGTIIVYATGHVDMHSVLDILNISDWDARANMVVN